jgi:hypothetical protein
VGNNFNLPVIILRAKTTDPLQGKVNRKSKEHWMKLVTPENSEFLQPEKNVKLPLAIWGRPKILSNAGSFLDYLSARTTLLGIQMSLGLANKNNVLKSHCGLLVPAFKKMGINHTKLSSTEKCSPTSEDNGEFSSSEETELQKISK